MNLISINSFFLLAILLVLFYSNRCFCDNVDTSLDEKQTEYEFDPNGYVIFCLCMGRFGNQADHFLGSMEFAKGLNRTFVVPPFRTYKNVPFKEWFKLEKLAEYHRIIPAEEFMKHIAPKYWPVGKRLGFCWLNQHTPASECKMKEGNPFGPFWDELGVDFDNYERFDFSFSNHNRWKQVFPADKYPVIALKGAPAPFPVTPENRQNQKYLVWSDKINEEVDAYIHNTLQNEKFIGIHLRNGIDWKNACEHLGEKGWETFMASPQCIEDKSRMVTKDICFPSKKQIIEDLKRIVEKTGLKHIYIATDQDTMKNEIEQNLKEYEVITHHYDPWLPVLDVAILGRSEHFIGNCVSSFTSFVKRERDIYNKSSSFWAFN